MRIGFALLLLWSRLAVAYNWQVRIQNNKTSEVKYFEFADSKTEHQVPIPNISTMKCTFLASDVDERATQVVTFLCMDSKSNLQIALPATCIKGITPFPSSLLINKMPTTADLKKINPKKPLDILNNGMDITVQCQNTM